MFLLGENGRVPGDEWFVFYGQDRSPDGAVRLLGSADDAGGTQIAVNLSAMRGDIKRLVFVLTIDEAVERGLNFGMLRDVWMQVEDLRDGREICGYMPEDCYENVTSMTLGEIYLHQGQWKLNPVGNGIQADLAGQCAIYGVRIEQEG